MPATEASGADITPQTLPHRVHKAALGGAVALMGGAGLFLLTALHVALGMEGLPLVLLNQYFAGYDVTWRGAFVGLAWGLALGFIWGWLLGFVHNFTMSFWVFVIRTKHDVSRTKHFLDQI